MNNNKFVILLMAFVLAGSVQNREALAAQDFPELLPSSEVSKRNGDVKTIMNITPVSNATKANKKDLDEVTNQNLDKKSLEKKLKQEEKQAKKAEKQTKQEQKQEEKTKAAVNKTEKNAQMPDKKTDKKTAKTKEEKGNVEISSSF